MYFVGKSLHDCISIIINNFMYSKRKKGWGGGETDRQRDRDRERLRETDRQTKRERVCVGGVT